jgi:hypothetical protein
MSGTSVCGEEKRSKRRRGSGIGRTDRYCRRAYTIAPAGGTCRTKITTDFAASSTKKRADGPLAVGAAPLRCGFAGEFRGHFQEDLDCRSDGNRQVSGEKGSCFGEVHRFCFRSVEPDFQTRTRSGVVTWRRREMRRSDSRTSMDSSSRHRGGWRGS